MANPLQDLLESASQKNTQFPTESRYHGIGTATLETSDGRIILYLRRRFVPPPEQFTLIQEHTVAQGDRLDNIASQYLVNPELFWQVCDANNAIRPEELIETIGRKLRITLPEGIPGAGNV
jgi:hypothetical protein